MSADILSGATANLLSNNSTIPQSGKSEAKIPTIINNNFPTCSTGEEVLHVLIEDPSSGLLNLQSEKQSKNTNCFLPEIGKEKRQFRRAGDLIPVNSVSTSDSNIKDSHSYSNDNAVITNNISALDTIVSSRNESQEVQILSGSNLVSVTGIDGELYLLLPEPNLSSSTSTSCSTNSLQSIHTQAKHQDGTVKVLPSLESIRTITGNAMHPQQTIQIMNSESIPVQVNINELLSSLTETKTVISTTQTTTILSLSSAIISSTDSDSNSLSVHKTKNSRENFDIIQNTTVQPPTTQQTITGGIPNWAMHLQDCVLYGDTYTGYVTNQNDMDLVLNTYKKETQSLFAIRQTPSPAKDESADTVRLMWKSQYVPFDGIPFVNVGRRATVMECEYGPRKRNNALKRMRLLHGNKNAIRNIPNLTCPARLFVKKVRKFPQYRVPTDVDQKLMRQLQEQSLKCVRKAGFNTGEVRLYMQLPLPTAHRYHHIGNSIEAFHKELEETDRGLLNAVSVDSRVMARIQELVRQGFTNPFIVRASVKDFVENKLEFEENEVKPAKHNKTFYPPLIEIQNIIQQTQTAMNSGVLAPLPTPVAPPVPQRQKRRRTPSIDTPTHLRMTGKKVKVRDTASTITKKSQLEELSSIEGPIEEAPQTSPVKSGDSISLTLTDNQLENFSVKNFTYDQLQQLAKIGLIAINNAAKDPRDSSESGDKDKKVHEDDPQNKVAAKCEVQTDIEKMENTPESITIQNFTSSELEGIIVVPTTENIDILNQIKEEAS